MICWMLCLLCCCDMQAQNEMNVWTFGNYAGVDFNTTPASVFTTGMDQMEGSASVCDASGQLLFYTDGTRVYDKNHNLMPNSPIANITISNYTATFSSSQASVIVSRPQVANQYYVFSLECQENATGRLFYSMVDMTLNGGLGDVMPSQKQIQLDSNLAEKIIAIPGQQCNAWAIVKDKSANIYKSYNITPSGIEAVPVLSNFGPLINGSTLGVIKASPDYQKIGAASGLAVQLFDFDNITGELSNAMTIDTILNYIDTLAFFYGLSFSPDGSKLYTTYTQYPNLSSNVISRIYQYDVSLPTLSGIIASKNTPYQTVYGQLMLGDLQIAPDGKIYFVQDISSWVNTIDAPNLYGAACTISPNSFPIGSNRKSRLGLPNRPLILSLPDTTYSRKDTAVCGVSILSAANGGYNYQWSIGDTGQTVTISQSGTYIVSYNYACDYRVDTIVLNFFSAPKMGGYFFSCPNSGNGKVWLTPVAGDETLYTYTWMDGNGAVIATRQSIQGDTISGLNAGTYTVQIQNPYGCDSSLEFTIQQLPVPVAAFSSDTVICRGVPLQFQYLSNAPLAIWYFGDGLTSSIDEPEHTYNTTGDYTVSLVAQNIEHCTDTATQVVHVKSFDLNVSTISQEVNKGTTITLSTQSAQTYTITAWQPAHLFADQSALSQSVEIDSTITFIVYGETDYGCIDSAELLVSVSPSFFIPTAFSPNGDGLNDFFRPRWAGDNVIVKTFAVYDRWGKKVWSGYGPTAVEGWDGTYSGTPATAGVYFYTIQFETSSGRTLDIKGDVTLVR